MLARQENAFGRMSALSSNGCGEIALAVKCLAGGKLIVTIIVAIKSDNNSLFVSKNPCRLNW